MDQQLHDKYSGYTTEALKDVLGEKGYLTEQARETAIAVLAERGEVWVEAESTEDSGTATPRSKHDVWWYIAVACLFSLAMLILMPHQWIKATVTMVIVASIVYVFRREGGGKSLDKPGQQSQTREPQIGMNGFTELMSAAANGDIARLCSLLESGASLNDQDERGGTALIYAVRNHKVDVVRHLIERGANVDLRTKSGRSALDIAVAQHDADIETLLNRPVRNAR